MSLIGAVYGTLLINFGKTAFSESFPEMWLFLIGGLFIAVVMLFPNGLAGLWNDYGHKITDKFSFISKGFSKLMAQAKLRKAGDAS
jgi:urea transport system permease protein